MITPRNQLLKEKKRETEPSTFLEHLQELRSRFFVWFAALLLGSLTGYFFYPRLLLWLTAPLNKPLYYTSPVGGFETVFGVSTFFGLIVSIPVLLYQVIKFVEPSIGRNPIKSFTAYTALSFLLAITGILMAYYLVLPGALQFLGQFGGKELSALISTQDYFSFVTKYLVGFAILFQLPLAMYIINKFHKLSPRKLLSFFRYVFLFSFVFAAILTPTPDMVNQTIMAATILLLYLFSVGMIWVLSKTTSP
jgi:sec-independent protein translocase protein TatC